MTTATEIAPEVIAWPRVTAILKSAGLVDDSWFSNEARDKGTALHLATRFLDEGDLDRSTVDSSIAGRLEAYERFLFEVRPRFLSIEEPVCNHTYRYRGTLDRRLVLGGREGILDLKSPTQAPWQALQLAAYAGCFERMLLRWTLHLMDDGTYKLIPHLGRHDWAVFLAALSIHNWLEQKGR